MNQFAKRRFLFPQNWKMKQPHGITTMISVEKLWCREEMKWKSSKVFPVWEKIPRHKMPKGTRTIGTRWVAVNQQDEENPLYRSRLVAQEAKKGSGFDEFFAAMPSLSALKMLAAIAVTFQFPHAGTAVKETYAKRRLFGFLDVKRAHFSDATRELYVDLPAEAKKPGEDLVGRFPKLLCGTRDAPLNWELQARKVMIALGFKQGKSNPCIYFHAGRDLRTVAHGPWR